MHKMQENNRELPTPPLWLSLVPVLLLVIMLSISVFLFRTEATSGPAQLSYLPYAFLNIITPIISLFYGYTGITIARVEQQEEYLDMGNPQENLEAENA